MENAQKTAEVKAPPTVNSDKQLALLISACAVSFLEMFDFTVYSFFAVIIGQVFFAAQDKFMGLLVAVSVFGLGFFMRPLGSVIIGGYADRYGRKAAMLLTVVLISVGSLLIALTPDYSVLGIYSSILIIFGRLVQGFAVGGESGAALSLLLESCNRDRRGFFLSWQYIGQGLSTLLGASLAFLLTHYLTEQQLHAWGWRVPFFFILLILPLALYLRMNITESLKIEEQRRNQEQDYPFFRLWREEGWKTFLAIISILPTTALVYTLSFFMPHYLPLVTHIEAGNTFLITIYASVLSITFNYLSGKICDHLEQRKKLLLWLVVIAAISSYFTFYFVHTFVLFIFFYTIAVIMFSLLMTASSVFVVESFPKPIRATACGVTYALGVAIFGGTSNPIVAGLLKISHGAVMAPFWYLAVALTIGFVCFAIYPEERHAK